MLTRRKLVLGAALAVLVPAAPALAAPDPLLADILYGVSDALIRDYIYRNYEYGRWDGRYWWTGGTEATATRPPPTAASGSTTTTGTIRRLRLRPVRRRVTGLRLRLCGPRTLRAEGLPEDRARGLRSLHTVRARTRRISAVPATGRRMQAVRGPVTRTAAVRVRLTSEVRAAEARAVPAVPADAAAPQPVPHFPSGCGPEPHPRTPDGLD